MELKRNIASGGFWELMSRARHGDEIVLFEGDYDTWEPDVEGVITEKAGRFFLNGERFLCETYRFDDWKVSRDGLLIQRRKRTGRHLRRTTTVSLISLGGEETGTRSRDDFYESKVFSDLAPSPGGFAFRRGSEIVVVSLSGAEKVIQRGKFDDWRINEKTFAYKEDESIFRVFTGKDEIVYQDKERMVADWGIFGEDLILEKGGSLLMEGDRFICETGGNYWAVHPLYGVIINRETSLSLIVIKKKMS